MVRTLVRRCRSSSDNPLGRADLEKPLMGHAGSQALPPRQVVLDRVESACLAQRESGDDFAPQGGGAVVDVIEGRVRLPFLVAQHPRSRRVGHHVRRVPLPVVLVDGHHPVAVRVRLEDAQRLGIVEGKVAVAVGDQEPRLEQLERGPHRARRSQQPRPLVGPSHAHTVPRPVPHVRFNLFGEVRHAHDDVAHPAGGHALELPVDEGPAGHLEHRLGDRQRARLHARGEAPGEDDGLHGGGLLAEKAKLDTPGAAD